MGLQHKLTSKLFSLTSLLILKSGKNTASMRGTGQAVLAATRGSVSVDSFHLKQDVKNII